MCFHLWYFFREKIRVAEKSALLDSSSISMEEINFRLDQRSSSKEFLLRTIRGIGVVTTVHLVQGLIDNDTISRLFKTFRHDYRVVQIMTMNTLTDIFRAADDPQVVSMLRSLSRETLQYFNEIILKEDSDGETFLKPVIVILTKIMNTVVASTSENEDFNTAVNEGDTITGGDESLLLQSGIHASLLTLVYRCTSFRRQNAPICGLLAELLSLAIKAFSLCLFSKSPVDTTRAIQVLSRIFHETKLVTALNLLDSYTQLLSPLKCLLESKWEDDGEENIKLVDCATRMLLLFTDYGKPGVRMLLEADLLSVFMTLLTCNGEQVQSTTASLITNIFLFGSQDDIQAVLNHGFLEVIPELLNDKTSDKTKENSIHAISTIINGGSRQQFELVMNPNFLASFIPVVFDKFETGDQKVKFCCSILLVSLWDTAVLKNDMTKDELNSLLIPFNVTEDLVESARQYRDEQHTKLHDINILLQLH